MPIHDAYCRITPFELLLPGEEFAESRFPRIEEEARERQADVGDPEAFPLLSEAGAVLREIRSEDDDPGVLSQLGNALFHAFHFWKENALPFLVETGVMRFLADTGPGEGSWDPVLPAPAGYVQLPQHLVWVPGGEEDAPESVDGFFWSAPEGKSLSLLLVMGMRKDRPGLSVVPLPPLPLKSAAPWASLRVRDEGDDFASDLPGAELENLYALEAGAEAVKLAMRIFWYLDAFPGAVEDGGFEDEDEEGAGPTPTRLPYRRVGLGDA